MAPVTKASTPNWLRHCARAHPTVHCEHLSVPVADGRIRVTRIALPNDTQAPVLFIPGWASTMQTWSRYVTELVGARPVLIVHTREKSTAQLTGKATQEPVCVLQDLVTVIRKFGPPAWVAGASTGANLALELTRTSALQPGTPVGLIMPHQRIDVPGVISLVQWLPRWAFALVKPWALWLMRPFAFASKNADQYRQLFEELRAADLKTLARSAAAWGKYQLELPRLVTGEPRYVIAVADDPFHSQESAQILAQALQAEYREVPGFARVHTQSVARGLRAWAETYTATIGT